MDMGMDMDIQTYGLDVPLIWCNYYRLCPIATGKKRYTRKKESKEVKRNRDGYDWYLTFGIWSLVFDTQLTYINGIHLFIT